MTRPSAPLILRRTDIQLLPFLALLFLLNSLDRSNIGNAETGGFTKHAGLQPGDLNDAVSAFFVAFVALQPVGAALGKRVGPSRWVPGVMVGWGVLTALTATVSTRGGLIFLRVLIGSLEAGFYPTTVFYLSLFYTRYEFAQRLGMFYGQYAVAGAFGGLVSYVVFSIFPTSADADAPKSDGWQSYQVLFVLEGVLTLIVAATAWFWLPTGPGTAWWLTPDERLEAEARVLRDRYPITSTPHESTSEDDDDELASSTSDLEAASATPNRRHKLHRADINEHSTPLLTPAAVNSSRSDEPLTRRDLYEAFTDPKVWYVLLINILSALPGTAFSIFLPIVLSSLVHGNPLTANLLSIPPFLLGAATLWYLTYLSDRARRRIYYILIALSISLAGLTVLCILPAGQAFTLKYFALCAVLAGSFVASPLTVAWLSGNIEAPGKRAVVLGINGWGNLAGVVAGGLWREEFRDDDYRLPFLVTAAAVGLSLVGYAGFWWWLDMENARRRKGRKGREEDRGDSILGRWIRGKEVWSGSRGDERADFIYGV